MWTGLNMFASDFESRFVVWTTFGKHSSWLNCLLTDWEIIYLPDVQIDGQLDVRWTVRRTCKLFEALLRRPKKSQVEGILQCIQISRDIVCWKKDKFIFEPLALVTLGVFFVFLSAVYYYISCHNIVLIKEVHFLGFMFINLFVQGYTVFSLRKIMLATSDLLRLLSSIHTSCNMIELLPRKKR